MHLHVPPQLGLTHANDSSMRLASSDLQPAAMLTVHLMACSGCQVDVLMPGFTHLQPAQTVRWSHWLMSHVAAWQRDDQRLRDLMPRVAMLPLGSGKTQAQDLQCPRLACLSLMAVCWTAQPAQDSQTRMTRAVCCQHVTSSAARQALAGTPG